MFCVYDGHGGEGCCNFLKDYLHTYIFDKLSLQNIKKSIKSAFQNADQDFLRGIFKAELSYDLDKSGSCALNFLIAGKKTFKILDNFLIFMNVGDSRAVVSAREGEVKRACTHDQKPSKRTEMKRVFQNGGSLYRIKINPKTNQTASFTAFTPQEVQDINTVHFKYPDMFCGPWRIRPSSLSVQIHFSNPF